MVDEFHEQDQAESSESKFLKRVGKVETYLSGNQDKDLILKCVNQYNKSCTLKSFPLIGQNHKKITLEAIKSRLVINKGAKWQGDNFIELLKKYKLVSELYMLFKPVASIVISDKISGSFYSRKTSSIYLASHLFKKPKNKKTYNRDKDPRSTRVKELRKSKDPIKFSIYSRSYLGNSKKSLFSQKFVGSEDQNRKAWDLDALETIYHELAHANDFYSQNLIPYLGLLETSLGSMLWSKKYKRTLIFQLATDYYKNIKSKKLKSWKNYIQFGYGSKKDFVSLSPIDVLTEFRNDYVVDPYGYSSQFENMATMFTEFMMLKNHGVISKASVNMITEKIEEGETTLVHKTIWKHRARILSPQIFEYALSLYNAIYGSEHSEKIRDYLSKYKKYEQEEITKFGETLNL